MEKIIYLKKVEKDRDIFKKQYLKFPIFFKQILFWYKNFFNIITKKEIEGEEVWVLPLREKFSNRKLVKLVKKLATYPENIYLLSNNLTTIFKKVVDKDELKILTGCKLKKALILKVLEYIAKLQNTVVENMEITILVQNTTDINKYWIETLSKKVKNVKLVSPNLYKFKKIEEYLYKEYGIGIQLSNSYQKSLIKSSIIVNLDFTSTELNEYNIFPNAIIINTDSEEINLKSKSFNGILIQEYQIKLKKELENRFNTMQLLNEYNPFLLYESTLNNKWNIQQWIEKIEKDKIVICDCIGRNGVISKKEFKNICKKLDKKLKSG